MANESSLTSLDISPTRLDSKSPISPLARLGEPSETEAIGPGRVLAKDISGSTLIQKRFITSDYDSSDSPSSSDHSDNVGTADDVAGSPSRRVCQCDCSVHLFV